MNKTLKPILGVIVTFIILALSSSFEMTFAKMFKFIPMGVSSQLGILVLSIIFIFIFTKKKLY